MTEEIVELVPMSEVCKTTSLSRPHIYLLERNNKFPKKIKSGRATRYVKSEVQNWIKDRIADRDAANANVEQCSGVNSSRKGAAK